MATKTITQLHRIIFRKYDTAKKEWVVPLTFEPDDLGADSQASFNIAPRKKTRSSSMGSSESPIRGTFESLAASVTFLADTWHQLGEALGAWKKATYTGADINAGQMVGGDGSDLCNDDYLDVVIQGICDDGSTGDVEFTRCQPSVDDDIEIGSSETGEVTLNLNPIVYNAKLHANDGHPQVTYRLGDASLTENQRLNAVTGEYTAVNEGE